MISIRCIFFKNNKPLCSRDKKCCQFGVKNPHRCEVAPFSPTVRPSHAFHVVNRLVLSSSSCCRKITHHGIPWHVWGKQGTINLHVWKCGRHNGAKDGGRSIYFIFIYLYIYIYAAYFSRFHHRGYHFIS